MAQAQNGNLISKPTIWFISVALVLSLLSFTSPSTTTVNRSSLPTQTEIYRHTLTYKHLTGYYDQSDHFTLGYFSSVKNTLQYLLTACDQQTIIHFKKYSKELIPVKFVTFMPYTPRSMTEILALPLRG